MEILKDTFEQKLPLLVDAINKCDFISIDAEFTGLHRHQGQHRFHTIQKRYEVFANAVSNFAIIQFGICTYHWSQTANRYFAKPFNFYVFPRGTKGRKEMNRCFGVQGAAFDFLTTCGFDFNKWVYHGVSYLTDAEEEEFEKETQEKLNNTMPDIPIDYNEVEFMDNVRKAIDKWMGSKESFKREGLDIIASNGYRRRLLYQEVRNNYPELIAFGKRNVICVCRANKKKEEERLKEKKKQFEKEKLEAIGFRKVIDLMSASGKTIVGHNVFLDLCHMINQFIAPLPPKVDDFKKLVHRRFPSVVDTKYLASQAPDLAHFQSTSLENIYFETRLPPYEGPKIELHWNFPLYQESKAHEAAYDAYITGFVFLRMSTYIYSKTFPVSIIDREALEDEVDDDGQEATQEIVYNWDIVPTANDAQDIDITNVSWDKKYDNDESAGMLWGNNSNNEISAEQMPINDAGYSDLAGMEAMANTTRIPSITKGTTSDNETLNTVYSTATQDSNTVTFEKDEIANASSVPEEEKNNINVLKYYEEGEFLAQYTNKLSLIKSVAPYISLAEPEVLSDQSRYFHIFPKERAVEESTLKPILQQFGNFFLEWNERWSVFVAFDKLTLDQKIVKKELEKPLHSAGLQVETMYEYIDNEAANAVHSNLEQSFNSLDI